METTNKTMHKNQRIIVHKYELMYAQQILKSYDNGKGEETTAHTGYVLYFKQLNTSPASTIFTRVYIIRVPWMAIDTEVLDHSKKVIVEGYALNGHLHIVQRIPDDLPTFNPNEYENMGAFPMFKLQEGEELTEGMFGTDCGIYDNYTLK